MKKCKKLLGFLLTILLLTCLFSTTALAAGTGDVAGAIEGTWSDASEQIKQVVDNVVFPVIDLILAVFFFGKLGMAYFDYRKHGQFEWTAPAILFACLVFTLTAPAQKSSLTHTPFALSRSILSFPAKVQLTSPESSRYTAEQSV